jgi:hypothetical protein
MVPGGSAAVWQAATARWAEIASEIPDLAPALALQRSMLRILLDAAERLEAEGGPQLPTSSDAITAKWIRGIPAFRNEILPIPGHLTDTLAPLCRALTDGGAGDAVSHIAEALSSGTVDGGSLLRVSLARDEKAIRTSALHMGLSPDLVWLIGELAASPLAYHLQRHLLSRSDLVTPLTMWDRGYCPCCGSWPTLIEAVSGLRLLRCSFCAAAWQLSNERCLYCDNAGADFVKAAPDVARTARRVELCGACGSYTKVIDVASPTRFPLLAIEDLASVDLDRGAMAREYGRPKLFDLDAIEPRSSGCA